ncbi:MAG: DUF4252 domain-containing protein [Polaribacter sp.]|jgi:wyosine [tRNA(Phe)-imidazoG37] synthetase (radical SAM superfamily)|nr:DUF4252 domain-containing protein [Polaribacter sp.]
MKKTILLLLFVTTPIVLTAQSLFDSLEDLKGVDMVVVTKDAFDLISKFKNIKIEDNEGMKVFEMIQDLKEFKMFSTNDAKVATIMGELVNASIKNQNLTELMRIKDDTSRVKIYVKTTKNKDFVSEVLMFVKGLGKKTNKVSEAVIVSLIGSIDINKISELADTF